MEHVKLFARAIGWRWVSIPGVILAAGTFATGVAKDSGMTGVLPYLDTKYLYGLAVLVLVLWFLIGLTHYCVLQSRQITASERAWDRTGRYLIPIREALDIIQASLEFAPEVLEKGKRLQAAAKVREVGKENQIKFWGFEYHEDTKMFEDNKDAIQPQFWKVNMLDLDVIYNQPDGYLSVQTKSDPVHDALLLRGEDLREYGGIMVSINTLKAMFPPRGKR